MKNSKQNSVQLTKDLFIREVEKEDKVYYILRSYFTYMEDGRELQGKKDIFINENIANELLNLLKK